MTRDYTWYNLVHMNFVFYFSFQVSKWGEAAELVLTTHVY